MKVTATEAKNRFGMLCREAKAGAVLVEKDGKPDSVILSYAEYQRLTAGPAPAMQARRRQFKAAHGAWVEALNTVHEAKGLWNQGMEPW